MTMISSITFLKALLIYFIESNPDFSHFSVSINTYYIIITTSKSNRLTATYFWNF